MRRAARGAGQRLHQRVARNLQHVFVLGRAVLALLRIAAINRAVFGHRRPVRHRTRRAVDQRDLELEEQRLAHLDGIGRLLARRIGRDRDRGVAGVARKAEREAGRNRQRHDGVRIPPHRRQHVFELHVERRGQAAVGHHQIDDHHAVGGRAHGLGDIQHRFDHRHVDDSAGVHRRISVVGNGRRIGQNGLAAGHRSGVGTHVQRQQIELDRERVVRAVVVVRHHRQPFERKDDVVARTARRRHGRRARQAAAEAGHVHPHAERHVAHPRRHDVRDRQVRDRRFGQRHRQPIRRPFADLDGAADGVRRTRFRRARQRLRDDHVGNAQRVLRRIRVTALDAHGIGLVNGIRHQPRAVGVDRPRLHRLRQTHREREFQRFADLQRVGRLVEARRIADVVDRRIGRPRHRRERESVGHGAVRNGARVENRAVQHVRNVEIVGRRQSAVGHHQSHRDLVARIAAVRRHRLGNRQLRLDQGDRRPDHRRRRIRIARVGHARAVGEHRLRHQSGIGRQVQDHRVVAQHHDRIGSARLVLQERVAFPNDHQVFAARAQRAHVRRDVGHGGKLSRRRIGVDLQRTDHVGHAGRQVVADRQIGDRQVGQLHRDLVGRDFADLQVRQRRIRRPGLARGDQQLRGLEVLGDERRRIRVAGVALDAEDVRARQRVAHHRREVRHRHVGRQRVGHAHVERERQRLADLDRVRAGRRVRVRQDPEGVAGHLIDEAGGQNHVGQFAQIVDRRIEHVFNRDVVGRRRARVGDDQRDRQHVVRGHVARRRQRLENPQARLDGLDHDRQRVARPQRVVEVGHVRPVRQQRLRRQAGNRGGIQHEGLQAQRQRVVSRVVVPGHHGVAEKLDGDRSAVRAERPDVRSHGRTRRQRPVEAGRIHGHGSHHERHARRHEIAERQVRHRAFGQREVELVGHRFADLHVRRRRIRRKVYFAGADKALGETPRQACDRVARVGRVAPLDVKDVRRSQRIPGQRGHVGRRQQGRHVGRHGHLEGELQELAHLDRVGPRRAVGVGSDRQRIADQAEHEAGRRDGVGNRRGIEIDGIEQVGDRHVVGRRQPRVGDRQLDVHHVARIHVGLHDVLRQRQARLDDGGGHDRRGHRSARIAAIGQRGPVRMHRLAARQPAVGCIVQHQVVQQHVERVVGREVVARGHHVRERERHRLAHRRKGRGRGGRALHEAADVADEAGGGVQPGRAEDIRQAVGRNPVHHRQVRDRRFGQRDGQTVGEHFADLHVRTRRIGRKVCFARRFKRLGQGQPRHGERDGVVGRVVALGDAARRRAVQRRAVGDVHPVRVDLARPHPLRQRHREDARRPAVRHERRVGHAVHPEDPSAGGPDQFRRPARRHRPEGERGEIVDVAREGVRHHHVVGVGQRVDLVGRDHREGHDVARVGRRRAADLLRPHVVLDDPVDRPRRAQRREGIHRAHHVAAPRRRPRPDAHVGRIGQRHEFQPQQEVVVGKVSVRRVGDGGEREDHRQAGTVLQHRGGRRRIGVRDRQTRPGVRRELRSARRDLELIAAARIGQRRVRVRPHPVDAGRHRIRQHQVADDALRHVDPDFVDEPLADGPVVGPAIGQRVGLRRGHERLGNRLHRLRSERHLRSRRIVVQQPRAVRPVALVAVLRRVVQRQIGRARPVRDRRAHELVHDQRRKHEVDRRIARPELAQGRQIVGVETNRLAHHGARRRRDERAERQARRQRIREHDAVGAGAARARVDQAVREDEDVAGLHQVRVHGLGELQHRLVDFHLGCPLDGHVGHAFQREIRRRDVGDHRAVLHVQAVRHHHRNVHRERGRVRRQRRRLQREDAGARVPHRAGDAAGEGIVDRRAEAQLGRQAVRDRHGAEFAAEVQGLDPVDQVLAHARIPAGSRRPGRFFVVAHGLGQRMPRRREPVLVEGIVLAVDRADHAAGHRIGQRRLAPHVRERARRRDQRIAAIAHHFGHGRQEAAVRGRGGPERHRDLVVQRIQDHARETEQKVCVALLFVVHGRRARRHDVARQIGQVFPARAHLHPHVDALGIRGFGVVHHVQREHHRGAVLDDQAVGLQVDVQVRNAREGRVGAGRAARLAAQVGVGHPVARSQRGRIALLRILIVQVRRVRQAVEVVPRAGEGPDHREAAVLAQFQIGEAVADVVLGVRRAAQRVRAEIHRGDRAVRRAAIGHRQARRRELAAGRRSREDIAGGRVFRIQDVRVRRGAAVRHHHRLRPAAGIQRHRADQARRRQARRRDQRHAVGRRQARVAFRAPVVHRSRIDHRSRAVIHDAGDQDLDRALAQRERRQIVACQGRQRRVAPDQRLADHRVRGHRRPAERNRRRQHVRQRQVRHVGRRGGVMADRHRVDHFLAQVRRIQRRGLGHFQQRFFRRQHRHHFAVGHPVPAQVREGPFGDEPVVARHHVAPERHVVENRHLVVRLHRRQQRDQGRIPNQRIARQAAAGRVADGVGGAAVDADLRAAEHVAHARRQRLARVHVVVDRQAAVAHAVFHRVDFAQGVLHRERRPRHQRARNRFVARADPWRIRAGIAETPVRGAEVDRAVRHAIIDVVRHPELEHLARDQVVEAAVPVRVLQGAIGAAQGVEIPHHVGGRHGRRRNCRPAERHVGRQPHLHAQVEGVDRA